MADNQHAKVRGWLNAPGRIDKVGAAIRLAFDWVIDGPRTGRYSVDQLKTSEKIYLGNRVEHETLHLLQLPKSGLLDTEIEGIPVDVKFSLSHAWMIPPEAVNQLCLLMTANDTDSTFRAGLLRMNPAWLSQGTGNRDSKRGILEIGREQIDWFSAVQPLPKNFLLHLDPVKRQRILAQSSGQKRINEVFRLCLNQPISTNTLDTLAIQRDPSKRIRDARKWLKPEGIEILGERYDQARIRSLRLPPLAKDTWIAVKTS